MKRTIVACIILLLAACCIFYGVHRGEADVVLGKAIVVCLECIGLG